jgi:hypothetical protein
MEVMIRLEMTPRQAASTAAVGRTVSQLIPSPVSSGPGGRIRPKAFRQALPPPPPKAMCPGPLEIIIVLGTPGSS